MNKVILSGRLTKEVETRYTEGATPLCVARYTLAVNRRYSKNSEQTADFVPCVAFGKAGEFAEKYFSKGQLIVVSGRLQVRNWQDKEGNKRTTTEIVIEEQDFGESRKSEAAKPKEEPTEEIELYPIDDTDDEDLPF